MSSGSIEDRLVRLEQKVRQLETASEPDLNRLSWWERISGSFKDDLIYAEAMKLARDERAADQGEESDE